MKQNIDQFIAAHDSGDYVTADAVVLSVIAALARGAVCEDPKLTTMMHYAHMRGLLRSFVNAVVVTLDGTKIRLA